MGSGGHIPRGCKMGCSMFGGPRRRPGNASDAELYGETPADAHEEEDEDMDEEEEMDDDEDAEDEEDEEE